MYESMRIGFYWCFMENEVYQNVRDFRSSAKTCGGLKNHNSLLKIFPASGPLKGITMDLLAHFLKSSSVNTFIFVITNPYSKLERTIAFPYTTASMVVNTLLS